MAEQDTGFVENVFDSEEEETPIKVPEVEEIVEVEATAPEVDLEDANELSPLQQYYQKYEDEPESLPEEQVYEGEEEGTYQAGSVEDYALQGLAGVMDTAENMAEIFHIPQMHKALNETVESFDMDSGKLVFNIKGFKNYDPNRDTISFMSDEEWDELHSQDKVSFMPFIKKSNDAGATLTRNLSKVIAGLIPAAKIAKGVKAGSVALGIAKKAPSSKMVKGLQKYAEFTSVGTLGSVFAFKPFEPRIADDMVGFVKDTPFEVTQPFFEWMSSADSDSVAEERFKIALEAMVIDAALVGVAIPAFSTFFKVFKRERKLAKAEMQGAPLDELNAINDIEIAAINSGDAADVMYPPSLTPIKVEAREAVSQLKDSALDVEDFIPLGAVDDVSNKVVLESVSLSTEGVNNAVKALARAAVTGEDVGLSATMQIAGRTPLINLNTVKDTGVKNIINALANEIDREAHLLGKVVLDQYGQPVKNVAQKDKKSFTQATKEATVYAKYINQRSSFDAKHFLQLGNKLGKTEEELFKMMQPDLLMADQIGSRTLAWQMVLDDITSQVGKALDGRDLSDPFIIEQASRQLEVINNLWNAFTEMPRGIARALAQRRIMMDKKYLKQSKDGTYVPKPDVDLSPEDVLARKAFLKKHMKNKGMNQELLETLRSAMGMARNASERSIALRKGLTASFQGRKAMLEMYRGLLLTNLKTMTTNFLGNTMETLMIPLSRTIGHMATFNLKGVKEEIGFMANMVMSINKATRAGMDSLINERNLLDPLRTKSEALNGEIGAGFYMQMDKAVNAGYWHPQNWVPLMVNTAGKVGRASLRVLGAQDEWFKTLTYNGKAMSRIAKEMPEGLSRAEKKEFVKKHLDMFYDDAGEAVDRELLDYSRRAAFQEDLEKGWVNNLHLAVGKTPELGIILPFVRTPANLISRAIQRTPVANFMSKRTRRMWTSGNPDEKAEVIGNTIIGTGIFGTALGYSMSGNITGSGPLDYEKNRLWRTAGFKPYHIKVGETWYKYDRLEPLMMPFIYVSSLHENLYRFNDHPDDLQDAIGIFVATSARTLIDRTWLRGLKGFMDGFDTAMDSDGGATYQDILGSFAANLIPAGINQVHRLSGLADEQSGAYSFREALSWQDKMMKKLPPVEGYDAVKHNWLTGKPMLLPNGGNFGLDNTKEEPSKYMEELLRFGPNIQGVSKKLGEVDLSSKQYSRLTELTGTLKIDGLTLMDQLEELMDLPEYDFDENRVYHDDYPSLQQKTVNKVINAYKEHARLTLLSEDKTLHKEWEKANEEKLKVGMGMEL